MVRATLSKALMATVIFSLGLGLVVLPTQTASANDLIRLWGRENTGMAGGQFLRIPAGARAVALGKAYSACATDGSAAFWNPAGIMRTPGRKNFFASHTEYTADIDLHYLSFHMRQQNFGYGLSMGILRSGDIPRTDEYHQEGTGQFFNANQFFLGGTVARAMTDRFSIGGTVKYYQENLDEFQIKSVLLDMGILYFVGYGDLRVGFSVRNFGNDLKPGGTPPAMLDGYIGTTEFQSYAAPTVGTFGAARTWQLSDNLNLLTTTDFNHPGDAQESFRMGGELGLNQQLYLRGGYETSRDEGGFSAGFGLQLKQRRYQVRLDYAYSDMGSFGTIHHISLDLSPLFQPKNPDAWRRRGR